MRWRLEDEKLVHKVRVRLPGHGHQQPEGDFPVISRENILLNNVCNAIQFNSESPLDPSLVVIPKGDLYFVRNQT